MKSTMRKDVYSTAGRDPSSTRKSSKK